MFDFFTEVGSIYVYYLAIFKVKTVFKTGCQKVQGYVICSVNYPLAVLTVIQSYRRVVDLTIFPRKNKNSPPDLHYKLLKFSYK